MLFLCEELINDHIKLTNYIKSEEELIKSIMQMQKALKNILLSYMQKFADSTNHIATEHVDSVLKFLEDLKNCLDIANKNIFLLREILKLLENLLLELKNYNTLNSNTVSNFNNKYSEINKTIFPNTVTIQDFLDSLLPYCELKFSDATNTNEVITSVETEIEATALESNNSEILNTQEKNSEDLPKTKNKSENSNKEVTECEDLNKVEKIKKEELLKPTTENNNIENTLIISEIKGKVILPYSMTILNEKLKNEPSKYSSIEDIIEKEYTLPFDLFKNPAISRFREAFKLVRNKEKKGIKSAFDLGMELLFNYNLHPAIITACKNLDELDIYLDYLENGQTANFDLFNIVFEIAPVVSKEQ